MSSDLDYELWCLQQSSGELEREATGSELGDASAAPLISLLLVAGRVDELWVAEGVDSVARQSYPHWELCGAQHGDRCALADVLAARMPDEPGARPCDSADALNREEALARALEAARGDYLIVLDEGDELAPDALLRVAREIRRTGAQIVYSNEDRIDAHGQRSDPTFKPGFSPERLLCEPYLGRLCALDARLVREVGGLRPVLGRAAEHDLLLRVSERATRVAHLPEIVYHRRELPGLAAAGDPGSVVADPAAAVVEAALQRRGEDAVARTDPDSGAVTVLRRPAPGARVSLIVRCERRPARMPLVRQLERGARPPDEVIVAGRRPHHEPAMRAIEDPRPARAANLAAAEAIGDVLVFCTQSCAPAPGSRREGLDELVANALRPDVGAVSGAVIDGRGELRHGGARVDLEGLSGPTAGALDRHGAGLPLNPGGAAADLVAIEREKFVRIGGFDDRRLPGSLFVLDLAFRLEEEGLLSVFIPGAAVRCRDLRSFPGSTEAEYMWWRWRERLNRLLAYERSPLDPGRSPLAPERPAATTVLTRPLVASG